MARYLLIISVLLNIVLGYFLITKKETISDSNELVQKIDSLESEISINQFRKDSIVIKIDSITEFIKENQTNYEKNVNIINSNNTSEDYIFFISYLNKRFNCNYNVPTTQTD